MTVVDLPWQSVNLMNEMTRIANEISSESGRVDWTRLTAGSVSNYGHSGDFVIG